MAFTYKQVPEVKSGQTITSGQYNALADAINDRLKNGVADPSWRLFWYADSLFQYIRNGDGSKNPVRDEWWSHWSHMTPDNAKDWTVADVGEVDGINASNPIAAFVYGNQGLNIYNETDRMDYDSRENTGIKLQDLIAGSPVSDEDHWEIAKIQRGVTTPARDDLSVANALAAADQYYRINYGKQFSFLKGYGGFHAGPDVVGPCNEQSIAEYLVKFRHIDSGDDCVYNTCPDKSGSGTGNCPSYTLPIQGWFAGVYGYVLYHYNGDLTTLPYTDYVEGPYTENAFLNHERGGQLDFAVNAYASEFRGADNGAVTQRNEQTWKPQKHAFRFENFFTQQYYLAPAYGNGPYGLTADYPKFDFPNSTTSGTYGLVDESATYVIKSGFCLAGVIVIGENIDVAKSFGIYADGELVHTLHMDTGEDPSTSFYFPDVIPEGAIIKVKTNDSFSATEEAYVEIAEIMSMTPRVQDAYAVLRMASSRSQTMDGWGHEEADSKGIWDDYQRHGMAVNYLRSGLKDQDQQAMWKNPVYEEVRRIVHDRLRLAKRDLFQGYEINGSGNSVLYFKRYPAYLLGGVDTDIDVFEGIAPSANAISSGYVRAGVEYKVTGTNAVIAYNGTEYSEGDTFTGKYKFKNWTVIGGTPVVYEYQILIDEAPKQGETNQWQLFLQTLPYKDSGSSVYKPSVFADRDGMFVDRCTLFSSSWGELTDQASEIRNHVYARQRKPIVRQENPSGYRYVLGTNQPSAQDIGNLVADRNTSFCNTVNKDPDECDGQVAHYKSCQIYVPDYELKSVTYDRSTQMVAVELNGRLRRNTIVDAQAITDDLTSWQAYMDADDNTAGSPSGPAAARSDENAVVEYLIYKNGGGECTIRIGDQSGDAGSGSDWQANLYNGACFPRFHFTKQMPKVYADGNNELDTHDTRMTVDNILWSSFVIRAICEGYLDRESDAALTPTIDPPCLDKHCGQNRMYDYRYSTLMLQAMGNRWFTMHPKVADSYNWEGFGPFPQMECYADHFNQIARSLNLLTRARIELPVLGIKNRKKTYTAFYASGAIDPAEYSFSASLPNNLQWTLTNTQPWFYDVPTGVCDKSVILDAKKTARIATVDGVLGIQVTRTDYEYELDFGETTVENMAKFALPDDLLGMVSIENGSYGYMGAVDTVYQTAEAVANPAATDCAKNIDGTLYEFQQFEDVTVNCQTVYGGTLEAPKPRASAYGKNLSNGCSVGSDSQLNITFDTIRVVVNVPLR